MKPTSIFVTYNPKSDLEQTLAVRLHTIGAVNGFRMFLPDRYNSETILDNETKRRIGEADYFIMFSTQKLSKIVQQEINYAAQVLKDKSRIIVIYNSRIEKNIIGATTDNFTALQYDPVSDQQDAFLHQIMDIIKTKEIANLKDKNSQQQALIALLGIGLGLFVLDSVANAE